MKNFWKRNGVFIIILVCIVVLFNIHLPYYVMAPGGTIDIGDRVSVDNKTKLNGSLHLLYVSEFDGTIATLLLANIIPNWDIMKLEDAQVSDESYDEIYDRNRIMLENAINNAKYVAYTHAGKSITVTSKKNLVLATTKGHDGQLKIGDEVIKADGIAIENVSQLKELIRSKNIQDTIRMDIIRDQKRMTVDVKISEQDGNKAIGVIIVTNYQYEMDPKVELKFKDSEAGSSGGLMTALSIYTSLVDEDILKGKKVAGTGTIDMDGTVGEIDGIKYKIMGAYKNKVDLVMVPEANYKEAVAVKEKYQYDIDIVMVKTFDEALDYLKNH